MKICHVITRLIIGGAQENTVLTCQGLAERGHDVTLIAGPETGPEGSLWDQTENAPFQTIKLDSLRRAIHPVRDLRALLDLRGLFATLKPDVVHTHSSKAGVLARRAAADVRVSSIVHTIHGMSFNRTQSALVRWLYKMLERQAAQYTTALITVADAMIEQAVEAGIAPRDRFTTIRSGMDLTTFTPDSRTRADVRAAWGVGDREFVVGTIARLFENKGYEAILAAMPAVARALPDCRFVWVGDGPSRSRYERILNEIGLRDRVRFVGLVPPTEVPRLINGFDALVHASQWEGLPRAVVQALLMRVPAISYDNDGAPEVVIPGETGILVPLGDVDGLTKAITRLGGDSELRRRMGTAGRQLCERLFDTGTMIDQIEALYDRISQPR